jgi:hypothetical protein
MLFIAAFEKLCYFEPLLRQHMGCNNMLDAALVYEALHQAW